VTVHECDVAIVGAGPVGLVLAMDLARRGVSVVVAERNAAGASTTVRCNHVSSRSMEILRGLGAADDVRAAGLPDEFPHDAAFRTTATGREIARITIPGRAARKRGEKGPDGWWPTAEPPHRVNQLFMEPVLLAHAQRTPGVTLLHGCEVEGFAETEDGVTVSACRDGALMTIRAQYLVGCDGGRSLVRRGIGARLEGDAVVQRVQSSYIRAPGLLEAMEAGPAWAIVNLNPRRSGTLYAIDGREKWLVHNYLRPGEEDFDAVDRDGSIRTILGVGQDFEYELLANEDWIGRRLVADKIREGRVFLAGDAAHIWVPYAGYGMNAGIADAAGLGWLLAAVVKGWGGEGMLDAYAAERGPITEQVSRFAMAHAEKMIRNRGAVPAEIEDETPDGEAARARFGALCYEVNVAQYCCAGLNFGYFYDRSPIIAYDGAEAPAYSMDEYTPSSVPGCRAPHLMLDKGTLYDALGPGYTLLRFDPGVSVDALTAEAARRGVPFKVLDLAPDRAYATGLAIIRPDFHVAWRGDTAPDAASLLDRMTGR
jgi:2-polyprenyl-6-methoxyphenol hydroxylase-like FAD-dependent oxidoreductase